jgi:predicted outer membrane repeat protein
MTAAETTTMRCGLLLAALALATPARALDLVVTRVDDPVPDGCIAGDCSLREAVVTANQLSGPDRILLPAGLYILTIAGGASNNAAVGDLDILSPVEIIGAGAPSTVILASHGNRHFNLTPGSSATFRGVRLDGGRAGTGGSILMNGTLVMQDSILSGNQATVEGGAIRSGSGTHMTFQRVRFEDNLATGPGGAVETGTAGATFAESVFLNNAATDGGAIAGFDIRVRDSLFLGNSASGSGGAIDSLAGCSCQNLEVRTSTFAGNQAGVVGAGGAIRVGHAFAIIQSTFSGNTAGIGGAIHVTNAGLGGPYRIESSTIAGNTAVLNGSGLFFAAPQSIDLQLLNTLVAGTCVRSGTGSGALQGQGNVESPGNTCNLPAGNLANVSAGQLALGPIADNGGPTPTRLPAPFSALVGAGSDAACQRLDQRGLVRNDGDCDTGAVEVGALDDVIFRNGLQP